MKTLLRLSKLIKPLFPIMALAILFGTLGFYCAIGIPLTGALALTKTLPFKFLVILGVMRGVLHYAEQYCNHYIAFTLLARIRDIVFAKLRSLGPAKLEGKQKGSLISLITSDIELLELFYAHTVSPVCIAFLVSLTMVVILSVLHWSLGLLALLCYASVAIGIPFLVQKNSVKAGTKHREEFSQMNSFLLDSLRGLEQSILYKTGSKKLTLLEEKSDSLSNSKRKMAKYEGLTQVLIDFGIIFSSLLMLFLSLFLYSKNLVDYGTVILSVCAMFSSFGPSVAVARLGSSLSETIAAGKRVLSLLDEEPVTQTIADKTNLSLDTTPNVKLEDIHFTYPNISDQETLSNINMDFDSSKIIGIRGKSGSGKSTALKLIMRFWKPQKGNVLIEKTNAEEINTKSLRDAESYVTQETVLFHDTIENNIRIASLDATSEQIIEACKKANIHDFIQSLPDGYQTNVSELGENFSGGERQRLSLARAFLHSSPILLLDEPTSNLDSYNEKIILDAIKNTSKEKTVIIVSHRDSTLSICDKVFNLNSGRQS